MVNKITTAITPTEEVAKINEIIDELGKSSSFNLFDWKWADYEITDQSWLKADTFSWQDGTVYSDAYNHLVDDIDGITSTTETIGSYTVTVYVASDGHKIVLADQETAVSNIYTESGVAWYYVLDTVNQRFKLPRENPLREELIEIVRAKGSGITFGWTTYGTFCAGSGALYSRTGTVAGTILPAGSGDGGSGLGSDVYLGVSTDSTKSGIIADMTESTSVYKGKKHLYFYVGQFSQSATEQTAGLNASLFNGKVDLNAQNLSAEGKSLIAGLGMPSDTYEDLTLGASGTTYTAPANGWFNIAKTSSGTQYLDLQNQTSLIFISNNLSSSTMRLYIPAKKGDVVKISYNATGATEFFRFIYAEGSESEAN